MEYKTRACNNITVYQMYICVSLRCSDGRAKTCNTFTYPRDSVPKCLHIESNRAF